MEENAKQDVAKDVVRVHGILDNLLVQPHLTDVQLLELVGRVMLAAQARKFEWNAHMASRRSQQAM